MPLTGTFRARFIIISVTGDAFLTAGAGDDALHYYENATKFGAVNYSLVGDCFYLDGSVVPIAFAGLPVGFTPVAPLTLSSPNVIGTPSIGVVQVTADGAAHETLTYGTYGPVTKNTTGLFGSFTNINFSAAIDLISLLTIQCSTTFVALLGLATEVFDVLEISGTYSTLQYEYSIPQDGDNVDVGDLITITSPGTDPLTDLDLSQLTISMACGVVVPIIQTPTLLTFLVPAACTGAGLTTITATGNGVQFSGSVPLGTLTILLTNASGIYTLVSGKTNDTLYSSLRDGTTRDVKIPDPFAKTGFIGG